MSHQKSLKASRHPKDLVCELIRVMSLFIETEFTIEEFDLVDQALMLHHGLNWCYDSDSIASKQHRARRTNNKVKFEFDNKDFVNDGMSGTNATLSLFECKCSRCGEQGHKAFECPENGNIGSTIKETCQECGKLDHKATDCWETEENADNTPVG
jgi:hypothetical protein